MSGGIANMFSGGAANALPQEASGFGNIIQNLMKVGQQGQSLFNPWINQATGPNGSMNAYNQALNPMSNPQQFIQKMMQGYQQSPAAQYAQQQGIKGANAAGAASGMLGSGAEQTELQRQGQQITQQDQQNYLNNMMDTYGQYLGGLSNENQQGLGASTNLASILSSLGMKAADIGMGQDQIAAQGQEAQTQGKDSGIAGISGLAGDAKDSGVSGVLGGIGGLL